MVHEPSEVSARDHEHLAGIVAQINFRVTLLERVVYGALGIIAAAFLALVLLKVGWTH